MTFSRLKIMFCFSAAFTSIAMILAFLTAPLLGSFYLWAMKAEGSNVSRLTAEFTLPMLRVGPAEGFNPGVHTWWVSLVWVILIVAPIVIMIWSVTGTREVFLSRWVGGISVYLSLMILLLVVVFAGLLIPLAPFPTVHLP